jgi:hypothetical protein
MSKKGLLGLSIIFGVVLLGLGILFFAGGMGPGSLMAATTPTVTTIELPTSLASGQIDVAAPPATLIPPPSATPVMPAASLGLEVTPVALPPVRATATVVVLLLPAQEELTPERVNTEIELAPATTVEILTGQWDFNFGTMTLTQNGAGVIGTYTWYGDLDGGDIKGNFITELSQVRGLWLSQNKPNEQGFLHWKLVDGQTLTGTFENNGLNGQWCAVRSGEPLPAGCGFSGAWNLQFGSPGNISGRAVLTQTGGRVTGTYTAGDGRVGEIVVASLTIRSLTEATLEGIWRTASGEMGRFEWQLDQTTNDTFAGRRLDDGSEWCGWREGLERPVACGF